MQAHIRREKNRIAARRCRAKKVEHMAQLQGLVRGMAARYNKMQSKVGGCHVT